MKALTPQELIDLPGAGSAEKHLRETGRWKMTPQEEAISALKRAANACDDAADELEQKEPQS